MEIDECRFEKKFFPIFVDLPVSFFPPNNFNLPSSSPFYLFLSGPFYASVARSVEGEGGRMVLSKAKRFSKKAVRRERKRRENKKTKTKNLRSE